MREFLALRACAHRCVSLGSKRGNVLDLLRSLAICLNDVAPALLTSFTAAYDRLNRADDAPRNIAVWAAGQLAAADVRILIDGIENAIDERLFAFLTELVDQTSKSRVRWIIVAPSARGFPLARWLADDRMDLPIDEVDLAITAQDLLAGEGESAAAPAQLRAVCVRAANWPAAIALLLSEPAAPAGNDIVWAPHRAYDYFATRAFLARTGAEQRFLLETCLYGSFDLSLLAAAGPNSVEATLMSLRDAGAFVFLDAQGGYRYHDCFRRFLTMRLRSSAGDLYRRIGAVTAAVYCGSGRWSEALEVYTELRAAAPLARLLSEHGFELMDRGQLDSLERGLAVLGDAEFAEFPLALALKATLEALQGSFDVAEAWFRHAMKNAENSRQRGVIVFHFATDLVRRERRDAIDVLRPVVGAGGHELALDVSLAGLLATAYATHNMNADAARTIEDALRKLERVDDASIRAKIYFQAGYVALFARDFRRAKSFARRALDTASASRLYDIAARALSILYNVAMDHEGDLIAARRRLEQLAACSMKAGSRYLFMYATLGQYEIEVLSGDAVESARLDEALKSLEVDYSVLATETLLPAQALRATWSGDFHRAYRLIAPTAEKQITPMRRAQRYAEIAVYAAAAGLRTEAAAAVGRALAAVPKPEPPEHGLTFTKAYVALALILLGRHRQAARILRTLARSRKLTCGHEQLIAAIRTINERWTSGVYSTGLRVILDRLEACNFGGIARLLEALPLPETFRAQFTELSAVEREVLVHLAAGLNAREIAALAERRADFVEDDIASLCRKLGCASARHAAALTQTAEAPPMSAGHAD